MNENEERLTITVAEAAIMLGISKNNMLEMVKRDDFPAIKLKRKILINKQQFVQWFNNLTNFD